MTKPQILNSVEKRLLRIIGEDADFKEENYDPDPLNTDLEEMLLSMIDNSVPWLNHALSDFNFKVTLEELREGACAYLDKVENDPLRRASIEDKLGDLIEACLDVRQSRWGSFKHQSHIKRSMCSPKHKNWKYFVKLLYILRKLGITRKREMRMYIKGVDDKKKLGTSYEKAIPIRVLASPSCVLDFLIYLKENWYQRHSGHSGVKWEKEYRERDFGQSHYLRLANQALGFLRDALNSDKGSIFSSEIPSSLGIGAEHEEFWAYYILACSKVTKEFWANGWLKELSPGVDSKVSMLKLESNSNSELEKVLTFARRCANELWEDSGLPMYGDNDDFYLAWAVWGNPKLEQEIRAWMKQ
jgi:hypothetical protein